MANKIKLDSRSKDIDHYEPSEDSDDDFSADERELLNDVRNRGNKNENTTRELYRFDDDDDDSSEDDVGGGNSDFDEGDVDDGIPDARAWGSKRKAYYNTDFVDQDYNAYSAKEEQQAEYEENEARTIQKRLAKQLNEADYSLDLFGSQPAGPDSSEDEQITETKEKVVTDVSDLSVRQKLSLFKKESPEYFDLVKDCESRLEECDAFLEPIMSHIKQHNLKINHPFIDFVETIYQLTLNYCTNVVFYILLKTKGISIRNHPVVKRLTQMRQLLLELDEKYEGVIKPELEILLLNKPLDLSCLEKPVIVETVPVKPQKSVRIKTDMEDDIEDEEMDEEGDEELDEDDERRGITYQIAKNKGLTPYRRKELRNPRVKNKNKYRKALIRRKGAVRAVRTETKRYGGELSGIKASVKKGIKIKS